MVLYSNAADFSEIGHLLDLNLKAALRTSVEPPRRSRCSAKRVLTVLMQCDKVNSKGNAALPRCWI